MVMLKMVPQIKSAISSVNNSSWLILFTTKLAHKTRLRELPYLYAIVIISHPADIFRTQTLFVKEGYFLATIDVVITIIYVEVYV